MKISLAWLSDYVDLPPHVGIGNVMHDLTMTTVEVEAAYDLAAPLGHVVVGTIASTYEVPGRPELVLATSDIGAGGMVTGVSSAQNLQNGMRVPVALPGAAIVPSVGRDPVTVAAASVHGVWSEAVVCGALHLGLEDLFPSTGAASALDLSEVSCSPGDQLSTVIGWDDTVLEIDNKSLTSRPDLWGHYGVARELAAIYKAPLKPLPALGMDARFPHVDLVEAIEARGCNRLALARLSGVRTGAAPFWIRSRLARIGQRPINLWVDLTNYVMFAVGQPCHAYDSGRLSLPLVVRFAEDKETIDLLDGKQYELDASTLVIKDRDGLIDLAGVMGGLDSSVSAGTTEILFEAGNFDALTVRRASARLGLRTEASSRFEKAIDTQRVDDALGLFMALVRQIQPAATVVGLDDQVLRPTRLNQIPVTVRFIQERLGTAIAAGAIAGALQSLGFLVTHDAVSLNVTVPSWRSTGDVSLTHDLLEEVARVRGYDTFDFVPPEVQLVRHTKERRTLLEQRVRTLLTLAGGMQEVVTYPWAKDSFLDAAAIDRSATVRLFAPPGLDQSSLRPSLVPGLLEVVARNVGFSPSFRVFELGRVFLSTPAAGGTKEESLFAQPRHLAGAFVGPDAAVLFRQAKGLIELIERTAHILPVGFSADATAPWADASARLGIETNRKAVGTVGVLTKRARRLAGIKRSEVVVFELDVDALDTLPSRENRYEPLPDHPAVDFDLSLVFAEPTPWVSISEVANQADPLVRQVLFVDEYHGQGIAEGSKSVTLRLKIGAATRTLKSDEINDAANRVVAALLQTFGARIRSSST